jgi:hypothetical protein
MPTLAPTPVEVATKFLKSLNLFAKPKAWDPGTRSAGPVEFTYQEAEILRQVVFPTLEPRPENDGRAPWPSWGDRIAFKLPGGWSIEMFYRTRWHPVAVFLAGPSPRRD